LGVGTGAAGRESGGELARCLDYRRRVAHRDDVVAHAFEMVLQVFAPRLGNRRQASFGCVPEGTAGDLGNDGQQDRNGSHGRQDGLQDEFRPEFHGVCSPGVPCIGSDCCR